MFHTGIDARDSKEHDNSDGPDLSEKIDEVLRPRDRVHPSQYMLTRVLQSNLISYIISHKSYSKATVECIFIGVSL